MDNTHHTVTASRNVGSTLRLPYGHSIDCQYDHRYRPYRRVPARDDDTYEQGITVSDTKMATGTTTSHCVQTDDAIADRGEDARAHDQTDPTRLNTQCLNGLLSEARHSTCLALRQFINSDALTLRLKSLCNQGRSYYGAPGPSRAKVPR